MVATAEPVTRFLSIGQVAQMVGRSATTLREMEAAGLFPAPARLDGVLTRLYSPQDVEAIRQALATLQRHREASAA